jgi:hypothetical protein
MLSLHFPVAMPLSARHNPDVILQSVRAVGADIIVFKIEFHPSPAMETAEI